MALNFLNHFKSNPDDKPQQTYPIYLPLDIYQDSNQSLVKDGKYDLTNFSKHELFVIKSVIMDIKKKYPLELRSMGFANNAEFIIYKPRYVLFEMLIELYKYSNNSIDKFACALAYASKGASFRRDALQKFEESIEYISPLFMQQFLCSMPLNVYTKFSKIYEREHEYEKAILYTKLGKKYGEKGNPNFDMRIKELHEKAKKKTKRRNRNISDEDIKFEQEVESAAKYFIKEFKL